MASITPTATEPHAGTVWLILVPVNSGNHAPGMYLELPLDEIPRFTKRPLKFLRYLGYVILNQEGVVSGTRNEPVGDDDHLVNRAVYAFATTNRCMPFFLVPSK